ncbi:MAG: ABC transporter ATP-binding protein [Bacillaceae bacterium]
MLTINNLTKTYKKTDALTSFSLVLDKPVIFGLFGNNGAGKSTLLKMLAGILQPTSGDWTFNNLSIKESKKAYSTLVGYMPDDFSFPTHLSIYEALAYYAALRNKKKEDVVHTLKLIGLENIQQERTTKLSKGMKQRLLFAQAIIGQPKLLLLDEPTNGLDTTWSEQLKQIILHLHEQGATILISSHQHDFLDDICHLKLNLSAGIVTELIH